VQDPDMISIYDAYCEEKYAKIIIATKEIEILFNERSLTILKEDGSNDNETKSYINKKYLVICKTISVLDRFNIKNI
ncbi:3647_t:CDS:2, partial [Racocetra persica]